jgi:putative Mg2+ transporter-C (MgtC) family protein
MTMPIQPDWIELAARLALTMLAGAIIGYNRGVGGHAAGLRTTILVGLAASVAMIQTNLLLPTTGKADGSFVSMDVMRIPLGILTGVGFIGGGTILKKGDLVTGVTTAATLWLITVIGLCFGGGQLVLGLVATMLGVVTLAALKWADKAISRQHHAHLIVQSASDMEVLTELPKMAQADGCRAKFMRQRHAPDTGRTDCTFELSWRGPERAAIPVELLRRIDGRFPIRLFSLTPSID